MSQLFWRLQALGWTVATVTVVTFSTIGYFSLADATVLGVARNLFGLGVTTALCPLYRRIRLRAWTRGQYALIALGIFFLCGGIAWVDGQFTNAVASGFGIAQKTPLMGQFLLGSTVMRWASYLVWSLLYFVITFWIETQAEHIRAARAEAAARASELRLLKAQVNPHFLFNALNSIQALAGDEARARPLIQAFADYLRFSLDQRWDVQRLGAELEALENYLCVEKVRFEEKLDFCIEADAAARATAAPVALVQPLLENAVKYGQRSGAWPLRIRIRAEREGGMLVVSVFNTGEWVNPEQSDSTGLGLESLRRRLELLYGGDGKLQVAPVPGGVQAVVRIPCRAGETALAA